jgi:hypothetical protein
MKKMIYTFFILTLFCTKTVSAQAHAPDTIHSERDIDSLHSAEWDTFLNNFNTWFHKSYCPKMKIKISCAGCSRFHLELILSINEKGKATLSKTGKENFCGKNLTQKQKEEFFKGIQRSTFSEYFRGKVIRFNFNRTLKC